ncbi:Cupin 4 family protein [Catenulispora acidiphila DSM 44928]|uniref:Cupin 4 family protein n=1 Tax=Catenulispora acidiphila (strain DSM 44928 / JCM 14897 / NBRC 102108 / NRRL B-24433 / ID139908) TaxID=479433 RepID=C7Q411_CATAD|nr:cupin domain-containing protein [Catenulispora acidiphila]ACU77769.1 Cupin 4 family protein [Catenulispora acidiphila DSM 44928]
MDHRLVSNLEKALGWDGPAALGTEVARGHIDDQDLLTRLLTPNHLLELVMRRHLANPQLRMYQDGAVLHPAAFLTNFVSRRHQASRRADMAAVGRILNEGGTLILDTINQFDPTLEVACRALGWWTGELVSVNAYLAVGDTAGFSTHWDDHDVLVVQVAGQKSWEVRPASRPVPMYRDAEQNLEAPEELLWSGTMNTGDVMHIPRGFWHAATRVGSGEGISLHLTFGITRRTGVTWVQHLADAARDVELFRTDLENPAGADAKLLTTKLLDLAVDVNPQRYLQQMREATPAARHIPHVPAFGPLGGAVTVTEYAPTIIAREANLEVRAAGKKLTLSPRAEGWARTLLSGNPIRFDDTTDPGAIALAERFIQEGLCAPLTDVSSSGYTGLVPTETF